MLEVKSDDGFGGPRKNETAGDIESFTGLNWALELEQFIELAFEFWAKKNAFMLSKNHKLALGYAEWFGAIRWTQFKFKTFQIKRLLSNFLELVWKQKKCVFHTDSFAHRTMRRAFRVIVLVVLFGSYCATRTSPSVNEAVGPKRIFSF